MRNLSIVRIGGMFLIGGAFAFMGVFAFLAARFNYPQVLDGNAAEVLPNLSSAPERRVGRCGLFTVFCLSSGFQPVSARSTLCAKCRKAACVSPCSLASSQP